MKKFFSYRFVKFVLVGMINTIVGYGTYSLFIFIGMHYLVANVLATIIGIACSFVLNKKITFKESKIDRHMPFRFVLVYLISFVIGTINLILLVSFCNINEYVAGLINLVVTTLISWFGHKYYSFREVKR